MALIKCDECSGQINDQAVVCPHCGTPIKKPSSPTETEYPIYFDDEIMDASEVLSCMRYNHSATKRAIWTMCEKAGIAEDDETIAQFVSQIYEQYKQKYSLYPPRIDLMVPYSQAQINQLEYEKEQFGLKAATQSDTPKCPTCGSTNLTKTTATSGFIDRAVYGTFSPEGRGQYRCKKCGYLW